VKKTPVAPLDALCRRWLPQNRNEQRCRRARATRPNALGGNGFFAAIISTLVETANLKMSRESLAVPVRARRSKTVIAVGSILQHFARQVTRTRKPCGRAPRRASKPTPRSGITAEFRPRLAPNSRTPVRTFRRSSRGRRTCRACRSAAVGSFYLVFFAPASTEQFPWSLGCEFSQVVIDCVSEADILLLMQSQ
jgi:hypothetical protein